MSTPAPYTPPAIWQWNKENGGQFASINRPVAGATHDKELPVGRHPLQLYSLGTPNGVKVTVMLEELLALGHSGAEYDAWLIRINEGEQFGSGFVSVNPNSKIPALLDRTDPANPVRVFESGAILMYLAEKFGAFLPKEGAARAECLSWLFWQMGSAPSGTPVLVNGREVPIVGRVAMDMICVDLGPEAQDKAGDSVILWGEGLPVERIAEMTKVSAYELITRLTSRVAMKYID